MNTTTTIISRSDTGDVLGTFDGILLPYKEDEKFELSLNAVAPPKLYVVVEVLFDNIYINKVFDETQYTIVRVIRVFPVDKIFK